MAMMTRGRGNLFSPLAVQGRGPQRSASVVSTGGGGGDMPAGPVIHKSIRTSSLPYQPKKGAGRSLKDMLMHRGVPGQSNVTDPRTGVRLTDAEVAGLGPLSHAGWDVRGMGSGGRIGSASGAANSKGTPTSQRGKEQRYVESGQAQRDIDAAAAAGAAAAQKQGEASTAQGSASGSTAPAAPVTPKGATAPASVTANPTAPATTTAATPAAKPLLPGLTPFTALANQAMKMFQGGKPAAKPAPTSANSPALAAALEAADKAGPAPAVSAATAERIRGYREQRGNGGAQAFRQREVRGGLMQRVKV